jgi:hypothetical protein
MTYENNADSLIKNNNNNNHVVILPSKPDKVQIDNVKIETVAHEPPDGGFRGYLVMICAFMCNGILFGIINSYSVVYLSLQRQLEESGDPLASSKACKSIVLNFLGNDPEKFTSKYFRNTMKFFRKICFALLFLKKSKIF